MRRSPERHTLAVLRLITGLTQKEFADLLGYARQTIQAVELGHLELSEKFAEKVQMETGISVQWLLKNDTSAPPIDRHDKPYTKEVFESYRANRNSPDAPLALYFQTNSNLQTYLTKLVALLVHAYKTEKTNLCAFKLSEAFDQLFQDFGVKWGDPNNELTKETLLPDEAIKKFDKYVNREEALNKQAKIGTTSIYLGNADGTMHKVESLSASKKKGKK